MFRLANRARTNWSFSKRKKHTIGIYRYPLQSIVDVPEQVGLCVCDTLSLCWTQTVCISRLYMSNGAGTLGACTVKEKIVSPTTKKFLRFIVIFNVCTCGGKSAKYSGMNERWKKPRVNRTTVLCYVCVHSHRIILLKFRNTKMILDVTEKKNWKNSLQKKDILRKMKRVSVLIRCRFSVSVLRVGEGYNTDSGVSM